MFILDCMSGYFYKFSEIFFFFFVKAVGGVPDHTVTQDASTIDAVAQEVDRGVVDHVQDLVTRRGSEFHFPPVPAYVKKCRDWLQDRASVTAYRSRTWAEFYWSCFLSFFILHLSLLEKLYVT